MASWAFKRKVYINLLSGLGIYIEGLCHIPGGRRTFVQRAVVQDWHFIAACQVNMPFKTLFFLPCWPF